MSIGVAIGAVPLGLVLTTVGWGAAGLGKHGPPVVDQLWRALIPGAVVVAYLTGHHADARTKRGPYVSWLAHYARVIEPVVVILEEVRS